MILFRATQGSSGPALDEQADGVQGSVGKGSLTSYRGSGGKRGMSNNIWRSAQRNATSGETDKAEGVVPKVIEVPKVSKLNT